MDSKTILICDDDPTVRSSLSLVLKRAGYGIATAETPEQAVAQIRTTIPGLILMDMNYTRSTTGEEGLELLAKVKVLAPEVPVILITAWGSIHLAVQGIRAGAFDFITKPWNNLALLESIRTAIQVQESSTAADAAPKSPFRRDKIIGKSPLLERVLQTVSRIASTHAPVLITGESGTGKELIAEAIHENSERKDRPFIKVNLGGISLSLFESEMFGHKKGAFTDAHYDRKGRFELADGGSIFLDEIGDLDMVSQVKLLRVLQDHTFESLGDSRPKQVDTRIICATNRNLPQMVQQGEFREDLFYRMQPSSRCKCRHCASEGKTFRCWWSILPGSKPGRAVLEPAWSSRPEGDGVPQPAARSPATSRELKKASSKGPSLRLPTNRTGRRSTSESRVSSKLQPKQGSTTLRCIRSKRSRNK